MKVIVITGSTRGIGYGLAEAFLALGNAVVVSGRSQDSVRKAVSRLLEAVNQEVILGLPCDVRQYGALQQLWQRTVDRFGRVDIWINNAGLGQSLATIGQIDPDQMAAVVNTNILGTLYGSQVAFRGMERQGHGAIYNMEGMGSNGRKQAGLSVYGTTKYAVRYITEALELETKDSPILVGSLAPGMVVTDLLTSPYAGRSEEWAKDKWIFNILGDKVETVTPWLAREILKNRKRGVRINWYRHGKVLRRFLAAPFRKRHVIE